MWTAIIFVTVISVLLMLSLWAELLICIAAFYKLKKKSKFTRNCVVFGVLLQSILINSKLLGYFFCKISQQMTTTKTATTKSQLKM